MGLTADFLPYRLLSCKPPLWIWPTRQSCYRSIYSFMLCWYCGMSVQLSIVSVPSSFQYTLNNTELNYRVLSADIVWPSPSHAAGLIFHLTVREQHHTFMKIDMFMPFCQIDLCCRPNHFVRCMHNMYNVLLIGRHTEIPFLVSIWRSLSPSPSSIVSLCRPIGLQFLCTLYHLMHGDHK